jgi:hypothetical protein
MKRATTGYGLKVTDFYSASPVLPAEVTRVAAVGHAPLNIIRFTVLKQYLLPVSTGKASMPFTA